MIAEQMGGQFSTAMCHSTLTNAQTDGILKTIVFTKSKGDGKVEIEDAVDAGYQIYVFPDGRTESDLKAVQLNDD